MPTCSQSSMHTQTNMFIRAHLEALICSLDSADCLNASSPNTTWCTALSQVAESAANKLQAALPSILSQLIFFHLPLWTKYLCIHFVDSAQHHCSSLLRRGRGYVKNVDMLIWPTWREATPKQNELWGTSLKETSLFNSVVGSGWYC